MQSMRYSLIGHLVLFSFLTIHALATCPPCIDTNSSACSRWGAGRAFFKWASDDSAGPSITLTAGSCGQCGESGVAYIFTRNDAHSATCEGGTPCNDGLGGNGAVAIIKVFGSQKAFKNIFPGGLGFTSDVVTCHDGNCYYGTSIAVAQTGCEYALPLASAGESRIVLGASVSSCDPQFSGSKFNISVKFYEIIGGSGVPDSYSLLASTQGAISVRVNKINDSDAVSFRPDLRDGSSIANLRPIYRNYAEDNEWKLDYRGFNDSECDGLEAWCGSFCTDITCLIPEEGTFYKVKYPGWSNRVNGQPGYAKQDGWNYEQINPGQYRGMMSDAPVTFNMMSYDMGDQGKIYYRGETFSGGFRVRQIERCAYGQNFGEGQILWTFCYDSLGRIQYIHNASYADPNNPPDPNNYNDATAYYNYQYIGTGNDPTVTYWIRPDTQSDWSLQPDRQWELEFDDQDRAVKFQGGCTSGCGGSGSFEHVKYYQDYDDLITQQYNAANTVILENEYEEIEYGQYEQAGWIQIVNAGFELSNVNPYDCITPETILGWDFTGGNVEICDPNDRGLSSQILRMNDNTLQFGLSQEVYTPVMPNANYVLFSRIRPQDDHDYRFARIELYAVPESGLSVFLTAIDANEANFSPSNWEGGVAVEWSSKDHPEPDFSDPENVYHFQIIIRGNYVDIDDIQLSASLWVGDKTKPFIKNQKKYDSQTQQLVTVLERSFNKANKQIIERSYVGSNSCRVINYEYEDDTFTNIVKKTEWQNPGTASTPPTGAFYETTYSNDANNITWLPGGKRADYQRYDDITGQIAETYRINRDNDSNTLREQFEYDYYRPIGSVEVTDIHLRKHTNAAGGITDYEYYDSLELKGFLKKKTEPQAAAGRLVTEYFYDQARRLTREEKKKLGDPAILQSTVYYYNSATGYLDAVEEIGGMTFARTEYKYNSLGQVIRQTNPDGVKSGKTYGSGGQLVSEFTISEGCDPNQTDDDLDLISQALYTYTNDGLIEKIGKYKANGIFDYQSSIPDSADPNYWVVTKYEYYPDGKQKMVIEDFGSSSANANLTTEYFYNLQGEVEKVIYPTGKWIKTTRDGRGLVTLEEVGYSTDTVVMETSYSYDADGNLIQQDNPDGTTQIFQYDNFGQLKKVFQGDSGPYTGKFYDNAGNVIRELSVDSDGTLLRDIRRHYDAVGNLELERICAEPNTVDNSADLITYYVYDVMGNLKKTIQEGLGCSDPNSTPDHNDVVTEYLYDGLGRKQHTIDPNGIISTVYYSPGGLPIKMVNPNDPDDPNLFVTENFYDAAGRMIKTVNPEKHYTINTYNSLNQLTKQIVFDCNETPDNPADDFAVRQTRIKYDNLGNIVRQVVMKDPNSQDNSIVGLDMITDYVYDYDTGLLFKTKTYYNSAATAETTYYYDDMGRKIRTVDPEGNEEIITYSEDKPALVEKTERLEKDPANSANDYTITIFFEYDDYGRLWKQILDLNGNGDKDSNDTTTEYLYDGLGRVSSEIAFDNVVTFTAYDSFGNVCQKIEDYDPQSEQNFNKTTEFVYSRLNRLYRIKAYDPNDTEPEEVAIQTTTYEYDKNGILTKITYPDERTVEYVYNILNKVDTEIHRDETRIYYWYDQLGNLTAESDDEDAFEGGSPSFVVTYKYNAAGNLKTASKVQDGDPVSHSKFTYNGFGLRTSETATYFDLEPVMTTWDYDGSGNLVSQAHGGTTVSYTHDGLGRIKTIDRGEDRIVNYSYIGSAAKAIEYPEPQITQTYSYDKLGQVNHIRSADVNDTGILDFVYDYDSIGNRRSDEYHHLETPVWDKYYYNNLRRLWQVDYAATSGFALGTTDKLCNRSLPVIGYNTRSKSQYPN